MPHTGCSDYEAKFIMIWLKSHEQQLVEESSFAGTRFSILGHFLRREGSLWAALSTRSVEPKHRVRFWPSDFAIGRGCKQLR